MNIILLSGGSGKRLWPLSNDIRSKQFLKIFKTEDGQYESMLQRMYYQIKRVDADAVITIASAKNQVPSIYNQLNADVGISIEPCRRDTFPAIALAVAYLHDVQNVALDDVVVVCPVDPCVEQDYFEALRELGKQAAKEEANLVLMGIEPTYPSAKYGYIIPEGKKNISRVKMFKEKPDEKTAETYIEQGALWNGGVFAFKLRYVLEKAKEMMHFENYKDLFAKYHMLEKISFDYAVVEHEENIQVMRFAGHWKDLGTWNTLTEGMGETTIGNVILNDKCYNTHVINELDMPILCMGLKDVIVSASPDGIIVSDKEQSSEIKPYVDQFEQRTMYAETSWGEYRIIDVEDESVTIKVMLKADYQMTYHSHEHRDEQWTIISGKGKVVLDGAEQNVSCGDIVEIKAGCKHTIIAETELKLIEIQMGKDISISDKKNYE